MRCALACLALACAQAVAAPEVRVVEIPGGGGVPDAETAADGTIHLAWVKADDVWYAKSTDDGRTFSEPLRVNSEPGTAHPPNTFRGPDVAVGRDGRVHVIWYNNAFQRKRPKDEWGVNYGRLEAKASAFTPTRNLNHLPSDGYSLAANERGQVAVVYMTGKVNLLTSHDDGETFAAPREIDEADPCECCASRALLLDERGVAPALLNILYRDKEKNVRDMFMLVGSGKKLVSPTGRFARSKVSTKPWQIAGCPMTGASLTRTSGGAIVAAWETKGQISFTWLITKADMPEIEVAPRGKYPTALANADEIVCVSWKEGSQLKWRLFDGNNRPLGELGSAPAPSSDRHAGAVTRAGDFLLFP